jgi:hypothetical protein
MLSSADIERASIATPSSVLLAREIVDTVKLAAPMALTQSDRSQ